MPDGAITEGGPSRVGRPMWNSLTRYHPRIGLTMMPGMKARVPFESGGYLVRTNAAGFRSEREFPSTRTPGTFRALLFGDSQTAGDGVSNPQRYSDILERLIPGLEVYNYALSGTSTDQHYLTHLDCADVQHDLIIIAVYVANIGRVASRFARFANDQGHEVIYAKPYYSLDEQGRLALHHVPVPKASMTRATISTEDAAHVDWGVPHAGLRNMVKKLGVRDLVQKMVRFQPVPEYESAQDAKWLLLRKILETWIRGSTTPVLLFPLPMWSFTEETSDPAGYQARYRELANDTGCYLHDPLPDLRSHSPEDRRAFRFKTDSHYTPSGHHALATSLAPAIQTIIAATKQTHTDDGGLSD